MTDLYVHQWNGLRVLRLFLIGSAVAGWGVVAGIELILMNSLEAISQDPFAYAIVLVPWLVIVLAWFHVGTLMTRDRPVAATWLAAAPLALLVAFVTVVVAVARI
ncbi:MAG: hypothetical protein HY060_08530 [Proteobacteria bacterium]|nr:hypothetical protein [Pseudomonadota bacterium]